ncbi:MAG: hypothetical protein KDC84_16225 [Crocinitomicaceae bacterium]|nr:hypothetical protein [Crocinitomicaceae bacterium]
MNKKTINSILLVTVLGIWGYVVYAKFYNGNSESNDTNEIVNVSGGRTIMKKDSFSLRLDYRDPFLGKISNNNFKPKQSISAHSTQEKRKIKSPTPEPQPWPTIRYYGLVKNASKNKGGTALISLNGKTHQVIQGDEIEHVEIKNILGDSIQVKYQKEIRTFYSRKKIQLQ